MNRQWPLGSEVKRKDVTGGAMLYDASRAGNAVPSWFDTSFWQERGELDGEAQGRGTVHFIKSGDDKGLVLRHYRRGGLVARVASDRYFWRGEFETRAFREWQLLYHLHRAGLPVPTPVAARYRRHGVTYSADLITERLTDSISLGALVRTRGIPILGWITIGRCIRMFHDLGVCHADLNAHNILLVGDDSVYLIDFDRGRLMKPGLWCDGNLVRLRRSLEKITYKLPPEHFSEADWHGLLDGYRQSAGAPRPLAPASNGDTPANGSAQTGSTPTVSTPSTSAPSVSAPAAASGTPSTAAPAPAASAPPPAVPPNSAWLNTTQPISATPPVSQPPQTASAPPPVSQPPKATSTSLSSGAAPATSSTATNRPPAAAGASPSVSRPPKATSTSPSSGAAPATSSTATNRPLPAAASASPSVSQSSKTTSAPPLSSAPATSSSATNRELPSAASAPAKSAAPAPAARPPSAPQPVATTPGAPSTAPAVAPTTSAGGPTPGAASAPAVATTPSATPTVPPNSSATPTVAPNPSPVPARAPNAGTPVAATVPPQPAPDAQSKQLSLSLPPKQSQS